MPDLSREQLVRWLQTVFRAPVTSLSVLALGDEDRTGEIKRFIYGVPLRVVFQIAGISRTAVLHTMTPGPFGHEHMADRARELIWEHQAFNHLHRHGVMRFNTMPSRSTRAPSIASSAGRLRLP